jgi:hypothetical protein
VRSRGAPASYSTEPSIIIVGSLFGADGSDGFLKLEGIIFTVSVRPSPVYRADAAQRAGVSFDSSGMEREAIPGSMASRYSLTGTPRRLQGKRVTNPC